MEAQENVQEVPQSPFADEPVIETEDVAEDIEGAEEEDFPDTGEEEILEEEEGVTDDEDFIEDEEDDIDDEDPFDEDGEEVTDDEIDELLESLEAEEDEQADMVPHGALHKERARRKEAQEQLQDINNDLEEAKASVGEYEEALAKVKKQLKDLDLLDVVKLEEPTAKDPKLIELERQQKEAEIQQNAANLVTEMREEASQYLEEYQQIDASDAAQAEIVVGLAIANKAFGMEQEDAVVRAMDLLNKSLASKQKEGMKLVRPVQRARKPSVRKRSPARKAQASPGNVSGFFKEMANDAYE